MARRPVTLADVVAGPVSLAIGGSGRIYLNGWVPGLQASGRSPGGWAGAGSRSRPRRRWARSARGSGARGRNQRIRVPGQLRGRHVTRCQLRHDAGRPGRPALDAHREVLLRCLQAAVEPAHIR